ncbi:hypothetical protein AAVH_32673, partial [Aphelenchoides avenae]
WGADHHSAHPGRCHLRPDPLGYGLRLRLLRHAWAAGRRLRHLRVPQRVAWAWLPVTVLHGVEAASLAVIAVMCLLLHAASYLDVVQDALEEQSDRITLQVFQIMTAVAAVVLVLLAWLSAWFTKITYRAYKWQNREEMQVHDDYIGVKVAL